MSKDTQLEAHICKHKKLNPSFGKINDYKHHINFKNDIPIKAKPYLVLYNKQEATRNEIKRLLILE